MPEAPSGTLFKEFVTEKRRHQSKADAGTRLPAYVPVRNMVVGVPEGRCIRISLMAVLSFGIERPFFFAAGTSQHAIEASFPPVLDKSEC